MRVTGPLPIRTLGFLGAFSMMPYYSISGVEESGVRTSVQRLQILRSGPGRPTPSGLGNERQQLVLAFLGAQELAKALVLDLADALARELQFLADFVEGEFAGVV